MSTHSTASLPSAFPLSEETKQIRFTLTHDAQDAIIRFPKVFDSSLFQVIESLFVNTPKDFIASRTLSHLRTLVLTQFFLQKKMIHFFKKDSYPKKILFLKLFQFSSRLCLCVIFSEPHDFNREQLLKAFRSLLPGTHEIPRSTFVFYEPDHSFLFCYLELYKLRGGELSKNDMKKIEKGLKEHLIAIPPLTPALFWPYNEEESFRQIQLLQREMTQEKDLPHVSIHFQEQTYFSIEFLIHLVRPKSTEPIPRTLKRLPESLHFFCHFHSQHKLSFPIEVGVFSLKVPSNDFNERGSINLIYARRYLLKYLEKAIGPFRDYNGGLFEKQQQHFEALRVRLSHILHFDLFAERVFYALSPVEARLSLSLKQAEDLFTTFSKALQDKEPHVVKSSGKQTLVVKATSASELEEWGDLGKEAKVFHSKFVLGGSHYLCLLGPGVEQLVARLKKRPPPSKKIQKTLNLIFQEGAPLSLNPYHSSGDMRCRVLSKLLFEGLTRLNSSGKPQLSGALKGSLSSNQLVYTFHLRPYHWSNGEKVTAVDYATSWQAALNDPISHPELLFIIKNARMFREKKCDSHKLGIRALDADTLEVELEKPDPQFLYKLAQPFFFPLFGSLREPKWFNGPYLVREQNSKGLLLEKNPYFWNPRHSFFKQIEIHWENDVEVIYSLFKEEKVDWIGDPLSTLPLAHTKKLQEENVLRKQQVSRRFLICFNTKHPVLSSPYIRRALSLAIDRPMICQTIFSDTIPLPSLEHLPEEANDYFEKGLQKLGLTRETFPPLTFIYSNHARREQLALCLKSLWEKLLGITIHLEMNDWNIFRNKLEKGSFEMCGTIQNHEESIEFHDRLEGISSWNFSQWKNQAYRDLIKKAKEGIEVDKCLQEAKKILIEEAPFTHLFTYAHLYAHHPYLDGYLFDQEGCVDFSKASRKTKAIK